MLQPSTEGRAPDGTFAPGNRVAARTPYVRYSERVLAIQELFSAEQIVEIAKDRKLLLKRSARDAQIIVQLAKSLEWPEGISNSDARAERETMLDRVEGKSAQTINVNKGEDEQIAQIQDERLLRLERELSRMTGAEAVLIAPEPVRLGSEEDELLAAALLNDGSVVIDSDKT